MNEIKTFSKRGAFGRFFLFEKKYFSYVIGHKIIATGKQTRNMNANDKQLNKIAKSMAILLPEIDPKVSWVDFLPLYSGTKLFAVGFKKGKVKYADVTNMCPFDAASHVMGCMEDENFGKQFLSERKIELLKDEIADFAKEASYKKDSSLEKVGDEYSVTDAKKLINRCCKSGVLPPALCHTDKKSLKEVFQKCVDSYFFTSYDAFLLYDAIYKGK